jgi:hypothetical protein
MFVAGWFMLHVCVSYWHARLHTHTEPNTHSSSWFCSLQEDGVVNSFEMAEDSSKTIPWYKTKGQIVNSIKLVYGFTGNKITKKSGIVYSTESECINSVRSMINCNVIETRTESEYINDCYTKRNAEAKHLSRVTNEYLHVCDAFIVNSLSTVGCATSVWRILWAKDKGCTKWRLGNKRL